MARIWDESDNEFLRENYMEYSNQELAERFRVTKKSIQGKLRRLGLHRANENPMAEEDDELEVEETVEDTEEEFGFRPKRLSIDLPSPPPEKRKQYAFVPKELTERRKRALREFDNAIKILHSGDSDKAIKEFDFIIETFDSEKDIVSKCYFYKKLAGKELFAEPPAPKTAEEYNLQGVWFNHANKPSQAMISFQKAVELEPNYVDPIYNLACLKCRSGDVQGSIELVERVLDLNYELAEEIFSDEELEPLWSDDHFLALAKKFAEEKEERSSD